MTGPSLFAATNFGALDWAIVVVYLAVSVGIGMYARSLIRSMDDFVVANRSMRTALGVASMSSTELGLVTVMYSAQKGFTGGFAAFHIAVFGGIVALAVGLTGFLVVRLRRTGVLTIPEFYERRFGRRTRILGGIALATGGILNMGLFLKVEAMFITAVTGMEPGSTLTIVMAALLGLTLIYTIFGGMVSDLVTDYVQYVVLAFGLLLAVGLAAHMVGWGHAFETVGRLKGAAGFNPFAEGSFGPAYAGWMAFLGLVSCAIWPTAVGRALAADSERTVKRMYRWSAIGFLSRFLIPYFLGICALVYVTDHDELRTAFFPAPGGAPPVDNLFALPVFLSRIIPTGFLGLVTAGMLAAMMSTYDSYFLTWSTVLTQDVIAPLGGNRMSIPARLRLTRVLMVIIGLSLIYWGLMYRGREDIWDYMAVTGAVYFSGAFAVIGAGLYWKRASSTGAVLALTAGGAAVFGLQPVQDLIGVRWPSEWVGLTVVAACGVAMAAGSLLWPDPKRQAG